MMFSLVYLPATSFFVPTWIQIGVFMGVVGVSGWLSVIAPKHPKFQKVALAFALALVLASAFTRVSHAGITSMTSWAPYCDSWAYYTDVLCWFLS